MRQQNEETKSLDYEHTIFDHGVGTEECLG